MKLFFTLGLVIGLHFHLLGQTTKLSRNWTAFAQFIDVSTIQKAVKLNPGKIKLRITA